jgi:hypothetical protein
MRVACCRNRSRSTAEPVGFTEQCRAAAARGGAGAARPMALHIWTGRATTGAARVGGGRAASTSRCRPRSIWSSSTERQGRRPWPLGSPDPLSIGHSPLTTSPPAWSSRRPSTSSDRRRPNHTLTWPVQAVAVVFNVKCIGVLCKSPHLRAVLKGEFHSQFNFVGWLTTNSFWNGISLRNNCVYKEN